MNKKAIIIISVFVAFVLGVTISYLFAPTTEDIPYTTLDDSSIESHITKSYLDNGNLIIDIYNPNCEIVKVEPVTIEHHVTAGMDSVKIFNYSDQYFEVIVGNASDVYTFGSLTKTWDAENKTVAIKSNGMPSMMVKLISSEPDLCTFTEVFEVTNFKTFTPHKDKDFKARTIKHKGKKDVTKVEWFIEQTIPYVVDNETRYKTVWQEYNHHGKPVSKDTVQRIKVVYHKSAEVGDVRIQTIPLFRGVECEELTWWNTSWNYQINSVVADTAFWYQMNLTVHGGSGANNVTNVFLDGHNNTNFADIRFTLNNVTPLNYWIEDNSTDPCKVYVNVTENGTVNLYYGNAAANDATDYDTTFSKDYGESGLVGLWHMDEGTSNSQTNDSSGNGNHGILTNMNTTGNATSGWIGADGGQWDNQSVQFSTGDSLRFDGVNDYINYSNDNSLNITDEMTVSTWIKINKLNSDNLVFNKGNNTEGYYLEIRGGAYNDIVFRCNGVSPAFLVSDSDEVTTGVWYNIVCVHSTTQYIIYKNGENIKETSASGSILSSNFDLLAGIWNDKSSYPFNGTIDEIRVYNRALSTDEIYRQYIRSKYASPVPTWGAWGAETKEVNIISYAPSTPLNKYESELQYFNVTTDLNCQCRWYINGTLKQTNTTQQTDHNYTNTSLELGYFNFSAVVNSSSGATDTQTWWVTVNPTATYIPPPPVLSNTTGGDFWANFTWTPGSGNITDSYNVSYNNVWDNGTTTTHRNESVLSGGWHNITVCAWNSSGVGTLSDTCVSDNIEAPSYKPPEPINLANTTGNFWVNHTWQADSGNVTDYWNVSVNGVWYNRSYPWYNGTYSAHDWQNISVWAWNNTAQGTMSD